MQPVNRRIHTRWSRLGKCGSRVVKRSASLPAWTLCYFSRQGAAIYLLTFVVTWLQCPPVDAEGSRLASFPLGNTHNEELRGPKQQQQQHGYSPCAAQVVWNYTAFHRLSHIKSNVIWTLNYGSPERHGFFFYCFFFCYLGIMTYYLVISI